MQDNKVLAFYERLSIEDKDVRINDAKSESNSIAHQRKMLFDFAAEHAELSGYSIEEYKDDGFSGTNFERPMFMELLQEVRKGRVAVIIVKDFSRLGRDYLDAGNFLDKIFPAYGIRFISINDNYDSNTHIGQTTGLDVSFRNITNEMYSRDISKKNRTAIRTRYNRGEYLFAHPFYGYLKNPEDKHRLVINEEVRPVIEDVFEMCISGMSTAQIAEKLNQSGIPCPTAYKKQQGITTNHKLVSENVLWSKTTVKQIIKDERYVGKMISGKHRTAAFGSNKTVLVPEDEWIVVEGTHEAIIDAETYAKAQEALQSRAKGSHRGKLCRNNVFTCPYCNHKLQFRSGPDKSAVIFCGYGKSNLNKKCLGIVLDRKKIEGTVVDTLNSLGRILEEKAKFRQNVSNDLLDEMKRKLVCCERELASLKDKKRNAYMKYREGTLEKEAYLKIQADAEQKTNDLNYDHDVILQEIARIKSDRENVKSVSREIDQTLFLPEYDPEIIKTVVKAIYLDADGNVQVEFHNADLYEDLLGM